MQTLTLLKITKSAPAFSAALPAFRLMPDHPTVKCGCFEWCTGPVSEKTRERHQRIRREFEAQARKEPLRYDEASLDDKYEEGMSDEREEEVPGPAPVEQNEDANEPSPGPDETGEFGGDWREDLSGRQSECSEASFEVCTTPFLTTLD